MERRFTTTQLAWVLPEGERKQHVWAVYTKKASIGVPGAFGAAYKATKKSTGETFVVKVIRKRNRCRSDLESFQREIHTLKSTDHPNVVKYYEAFETSDELFIGKRVALLFSYDLTAQ